MKRRGYGGSINVDNTIVVFLTINSINVCICDSVCYAFFLEFIV